MSLCRQEEKTALWAYGITLRVKESLRVDTPLIRTCGKVRVRWTLARRKKGNAGARKNFINQNAFAPMNGVVLQIEDDLHDVELFRIAVAQTGSPCKVIAVPFARDAILYLSRVGEYQDEKKISQTDPYCLGFVIAGDERIGLFDLGKV